MNEINLDFLDECEKTGSSNDKLEILSRWQLEQPTIVENFFRLFFKDIQYNISTKVIDKACANETGLTFADIGLKCEHFCPDGNTALSWQLLKDDLNNLKASKTNDSIKYIESILTQYNKQSAKWFIRFLTKNFHCGISMGLINKLFKKYGLKDIEKFEVQLCGKKETSYFPHFKYPIIAGIKYDGFRCFLKKEGSIVTFTSRQGKNVKFLPELEKFFGNIAGDFILDGEVMAKDFNAIQKRIGRKKDNIEEVEGLHFRCFDIIRHNDYDCSKFTQVERKAMLHSEFTVHLGDLFKFEKYITCRNPEELQMFYDISVESKEEGIVIKEMSKPYEFGGRKNWWKVKPVFENTFKIIDCANGTGKNKDLISKLQISDSSGDVTSNVGSGIDDQMKIQINQMHSEGTLIGSYIDIMYNEITVSGDKYSLRFPRVLKLRFDKEEADNLKNGIQVVPK